MIAKKNPKADLEKKRFAFFQIGLIVAGSLCLAAFEYTTASADDSYAKVDDDTGLTYLPPEVPEDLPVPQENQKKAIVQIVDDVKIVDRVPDDSQVKVPTNPDDKITMDDNDTGDLDYGITFVEIDPDEIVPVPDVEPAFPGGLQAMASYINENMELPSYMADYDQGTIYVQFVVNKNGSIEQVEIKRGLSSELNEAATAVVSNMPRWVPGEQAGKPVRVRFTLPIQIAFN